MAFIRAKKYKSKKYGLVLHYYLVESYREHGKVKQRVIAYLGFLHTCATLDGAIAQLETWIGNSRTPNERHMKRLAKLRDVRERYGP